ncbi:pectinesterase family protein [Streptomyces sp. NPDC014995]|uniref:pectinesterase family protein n=1 Tax=Streptomyces sp. NPDC014995 TaxID=3364936 RepID=UPI0037006479
MTTETQGGLPRRSFLAAMTAAGVLAGGGLGLVVGSASSAVAAPGSDITWHNSYEREEAKKRYAELINAIKRRVSSHQVRPDGGRPVYVTDEDGTGQYITVDMYSEGDLGEFIRVFMRRSDAYVMGWRPGTDHGNGNVSWTDSAGNASRYFPLEPGLLLPGATTETTNFRYQNLAGYDALRGQGAVRDNMRISPSSLSAAVMTLHDGANSTAGYVRIAAPAILQVIVAIAEGARFLNQAADTARAFGNGDAYTVTPQHIEQHNNWGLMSSSLLTAVVAGAAVLAAPIFIAGVEITTAVALASLIMMAHHSGKGTKGRGLLEGSTKLVAPDGTGDYWTVQAAIDAAPESGANTIFIDKGIYHEAISVPRDKSWLTIQGVTGNRSDVIIYNTRCHGMINPATGLKYGTQGSAVATFRPPNLTVKDLTISNGFDRAAHPEIDPYETQAVAVAAMGDRQVYDNVAIMSHQDTLLVKGETPTTQARQYFYNCFVRGDVDFVFGNATAVIDRSTLQMLDWPGGTVVAPNTDYRKKYGILITHSNLTANGLIRTKYLGRPWHNTAEAWPQALVRDSTIAGQFNDTQPWTNMMPDYSWQSARFREYNNSGLGAGQGANAPKLTAAEAADYTAQKYLAGTDGWNPVR